MEHKIMPTTVQLPDWFPKHFFENQWYIHSTDRNDEGRTPFIMYHIQGREVTIFHGTNLDSKEDYEGFAEMNKEMAKIHRDFLRKQAGSMIDARKLWLT